MVIGFRAAFLFLLILFLSTGSAQAQQAGSIRGMVYDKDFETPLPAAQIHIFETGQQVTTTEEGNYVFSEVAPGQYTLIFSKDSYNRQVQPDVIVSPGQLTEIDAWLSGEFTEMEEFLVEDILFDRGTEADLLNIRWEVPTFMDSISAEFMRQAGDSDAAAALRRVAGASVQEGKYAVIRGLPDRYVNSQMNGVRLPTADADKRAVQLDQFPSSAIESIQVSKTFTPDQQGDASGGAVNVVLKGIPDKWTFKFGSSASYNTQVTGNSEFLSYKGGGVNLFGMEDREVQTDKLGSSWDGAVGTSPGDSPIDHKWSVSGGGKHEFSDVLKLGGLGSFFYERDSSFFDNGIDDKWVVENPGSPMTPQTVQGAASGGDFKTQLFDVTQGSETVKWGALGALGLEFLEDQSLTLVNLYTHDAEDTATLAEDTRGKEFYFPGYDRNNPTDPGNLERDAAPHLRLETLEYTERTTHTFQLKGKHKIPFPELGLKDYINLLPPELDWTVAFSSAELDQPDKRQFGSLWWGPFYTSPAVHRPFKPAHNFTIGNLQRVWKEITEDSDQYMLNLKLPFEQWSEDEGYLKFGVFSDTVNRDYNQDSFSNFNDNSAQYRAPWEDSWSAVFPNERHPITAADIDVDYKGEQEIFAWYSMADVPLSSWFNILGGVRFEDTKLNIVNDPEKDVTWVPPGTSGPVKLNPGDADVAFEQSDALPAIGLVLKPLEKLTLRASYSQTVARQTFKELTPIQQQEYAGGDVFIGNPSLQMSALKNYDVRLDFVPYGNSLLSLSYFNKEVKDPIEYVQKNAGFTYTFPENYPRGRLSGFELEARQDMGFFWDKLEGLSLGANATLIESEVTLPDDEAAQFDLPGIRAPMDSREMTNAPEYLYNLYMTYKFDKLGLTGTELGVFYSVRGDTLVAGAGISNGFVPNVYEKEYGTLNLSLSKKFKDYWTVIFQAKNLTDPEIQTVYRSKYIGEDVTKTSYQKGMEFSLGFNAEF